MQDLFASRELSGRRISGLLRAADVVHPGGHWRYLVAFARPTSEVVQFISAQWNDFVCRIEETMNCGGSLRAAVIKLQERDGVNFNSHVDYLRWALSQRDLMFSATTSSALDRTIWAPAHQGCLSPHERSWLVGHTAHFHQFSNRLTLTLIKTSTSQ